ncbi:hypothetical protein [Paenibacillus sp. MER 99-2]|uniref:hypothetical protein n=1 Tax=Paenibacillus sp. MER 99-2 TaxID=2939572 RepID=UPI0020422D4D|nr:hypothetical protein [Paenibacillus sp. MER 99-2]MCM3176226.1 hypothetical protein [Paenibacillus sp. MER 99-2]
MQQNYSGFSSYDISNIYPNWSIGQTQSEETLVDDKAQEVMTVTEQVHDTTAVDKKKSTNMWVLLAAIVLVIIFFGTK